LLPQQSVLGDELGLTPNQIGQRTDAERGSGWPRAGEEAVVDCLRDDAGSISETLWQVSDHGELLLA